MKMFTECTGHCHMCRLSTRGCLAGHGDNDFTPATPAQLINRIQSGRYSKGEIKNMISLLKDKYCIIYDYHSRTVTAELEELSMPSPLSDFDHVKFDIEGLRKEINDAATPKTYTPVCPQGYTDCVYDPAYIMRYHLDFYKRHFGDLYPQEAAERYCNKDCTTCYDWEDK